MESTRITTWQRSVPVAIIRGGTSKGLYFHARDLPPAGAERDRLLLRIMGSPDVLQIDGLGGSRAITSKVAVIARSQDPGVDVDYTFAQVSVDEPVVQWDGNCGNISAGVGPFAIDEGLVAATEGTTRVRILNTNTGRLITAYVPVENGRHAVRGDFVIPGVPGSGSEIVMDWSATVGAHTGKLLPTGHPVDVLTLDDQTSVPVTICDVGNPVVWVPAQYLGAQGNESKSTIDESEALRQKLAEIRSRAAELLGFSASWKEAGRQSPALPLVGMIAPARDYLAMNGTAIDRNAMDLNVRLMFMGRLHESLAGTASVNLAAASRVQGSTVAAVTENSHSEVLRAGHPSGVMEISVRCDTSGDNAVPTFSILGISRTSRRIADARVYVPE